MLIVKVKKGNIERALKELKGKVIKTRQNSSINEKREYIKKSVIRRKEISRAKHKSKISNEL